MLSPKTWLRRCRDLLSSWGVDGQRPALPRRAQGHVGRYGCATHQSDGKTSASP